MKPKIKTKQDAFVLTDYPEALAYTDMQNSVFWPPTEIEVENDVHDFYVNLTEAEMHGVRDVTLKLFTKYEQFAGNEFWGGRVKRVYPRPEIQMMAATFSAMEAVHARFYNMLNEALNLNTEEFHRSYEDDPVLAERMAFLEKHISGKDDELSIAVFSIVEGAILYSSFAFLKHFQAEGKNKLMHTCSGIDFSVRDENLHSEAGAWIFRKSCQEQGRTEDEELHANIYEAARQVYEHEVQIIKKIFEKGPIEGITETQLIRFVESRIDLCLQNLGLKKMFNPTYNPIAKWFYKDINSLNFHDFFVKTGNSYSRDWNEMRFVW